MTYYSIVTKIKERAKGFAKSQVYLLENKNWTVLVSTYPGDEFIRISNKHYEHIAYCRPDHINGLVEKLEYAGFEEVV